MRCRAVRRHLAVYRELDEPVRRDVLSHIAGCPDCSSVWSAYQQQDQILSSVPVVQPSVKLAEEVRRQVNSQNTRGQLPAMRWAAAIAVLVVFGFLGGTVSWAVEAIPGDILYPVKRATEQVRIALTLTASAREEYQDRLMKERLAEVREVVSLGRQAQVEFGGELEGIISDAWIVAGVPVGVGRSIWDQSPPDLGSELAVRALASSGELRATLVTVSRYGPPSPRPEDLPTASSTPTAVSEKTATPTSTPTERPFRPSPSPSSTPGRATAEPGTHTATPQSGDPGPHSQPTATPQAGDPGPRTQPTATPQAGDPSPQAQPTATPQAGDPGPHTQPTPSGTAPGPPSATPGPPTGPGPSGSATSTATSGGHSGNN